ncbi:MAG: hypothetical protein NDJ92_02140 [Thermoanaerobaculia bacterium]|nr:hypothetical protein [Thermoanaerobaculia bacterium]
MLDLATITADAFRPHLNTQFTVVVSGSEAVELVLLETIEVGAERRGHRRGFSLTFGGGAASRILPQRTYEFRHPAFGSFELFIVPRTPQANEPRYEAVFN